MKILVTGGTGFTGSHLVKHVLREGNKAVVLDNQEGIMLEELKKLGADVILGSVTDPKPFGRRSRVAMSCIIWRRRSERSMCRSPSTTTPTSTR